MASLIRELLSQMILREVEIAGTLITITEVEVSAKLDHATVNVSVIPSEKAEVVLRTLKAQAGQFQHQLIQTMNVRPVPRISFVIDHGPEKAAIIEKLLLDDNNREAE